MHEKLPLTGLQKAALKQGKQEGAPNYLPRTREQAFNFEPHDWVVNATKHLRTRVEQGNYMSDKFCLGVVVGITALERGNVDEALMWLNNTIMGYDQEWPAQGQDLNEWFIKAFGDREFPPTPLIENKSS